jgi:hypothetical protein
MYRESNYFWKEEFRVVAKRTNKTTTDDSLLENVCTHKSNNVGEDIVYNIFIGKGRDQNWCPAWMQNRYK